MKPFARTGETARHQYRVGGSLADKAYREIQNRILGCVLEPGAMINSIALAEDLGMSRTPVTEALKLLANEGLVQAKGRHGHLVSPVSLSDVQDAFQVRSTLEALAVDLVVRKASEGDVHGLLAMVTSHEGKGRASGVEAATRSEVDTAVKENYLFHAQIAELSRNSVLPKMIARLLQRTNRAIMVYGGTLKGGSRGPRPNDHLTIAQAIADRDRHAAINAMRTHISTSLRQVISAILEAEPVPYDFDKEIIG